MQGELARLFGLYTLPETGFFLGRLDGIRNRASRLHCLTALARGYRRATYPAQTIDMIRDWLPQIGIRRLVGALGSRRRCADEWGLWLDRQARAQGLDGWIEKTPLHFYHLGLVRLAEPVPCIVFVVRNGPDVVASIVDRARTYPERFGHQGIDYAIALWNDAVRVAVRESTNRSAICVRYEDFVVDPLSVSMAIGERCGMPPVGGMPDGEALATDTFILPVERWKATVTSPIVAPEDKWHRIFTAGERAYIEERLDLESLKSIRFLPDRRRAVLP
jgi:hypothetical protein